MNEVTALRARYDMLVLAYQRVLQDLEDVREQLEKLGEQP